MKNLLVLQSGGPTAVINATLTGVVEQALISEKVDQVFGAKYGIKGVLEDRLIEIGSLLSSATELSRLLHTPSAALGSCRVKLPKLGEGEKEYEAIFATLKKHNIGYMICIGGNDSMDTVAKLSAYAREKGITDIAIMGAPKTIDNDLCCMDHSPGFASAARYVATTVSEIWADCHVYDIPAVTIIEIMGRHVGWLTASAAFAGEYGKGPDLIYLPESNFTDEQFIADVKAKLAQRPTVIVAVSEGVHYEDGRFVAEGRADGPVDDFGHKMLSGTANVLKDLLLHKVGCKVRSIEFSLMQRACGHLASPIDQQEARLLGAASTVRALDGMSGQVSVLNRTSDNPYRVAYSTVPVEQVANLEKGVPREWINKEGNGVTAEMIEYLRPLIRREGDECYTDGMPEYIHFVD